MSDLNKEEVIDRVERQVFAALGDAVIEIVEEQVLLEQEKTAEAEGRARAATTQLANRQNEWLAERQILNAEISRQAAVIAMLTAPPYGTPGKRVTISTPEQLAELSGRRILCPLDIRVNGKIDRFFLDITTGPAFTQTTTSMTVDNRYVTSLELSNGVITASNPSPFVQGINGSGIVTRNMEISHVVDGVNIGQNGLGWSAFGTHIHDLVQGLPHSDGAAFNKAGDIVLEDTTIDAGIRTTAVSLSCLMFSPGPVKSFEARRVTFLGGYPAINISKDCPVPSRFLLEDCRFGPSTYAGGASIIANAAKHEAIRAGMVRTTMLDGSPVVIAKGA